MNIRVAGASVRGPLHLASGSACEDAWLAHTDARGTVLAVADGLGSRPRAREGARAAMRATKRAWRHWSASVRGSAEDLIRLVEVLWRLALGEVLAEEAATTCLIFALPSAREGVFAQLGDGLGGCLRGDEFRSLSHERAGFSSETLCLGAPHGLHDWIRAPVAPLGVGEAVLLTTDGVSDDLVPEGLTGFARWSRDTARSSPSGGLRLAAALRAWPVPRHMDDKTLVVGWMEA